MISNKPRIKWILPTIVFAQFCCTSLWFAGNSVITQLTHNFSLADNDFGHLVSSVQFGFITGTLIFALFAIADRFAPSRVFFTCALLGALFNLGITLNSNTLTSLLMFRFATGFFLAGIYPIGMKIAADYFDKGLGKSLGYLVGALVLGTAFPHFLKGLSFEIPWKTIIILTSSIATVGGFMILLFVPNGPYRTTGSKLQFGALLSIFKVRQFRSAAFGYFGHMWELYTFWAFVPILLKTYNDLHPSSNFSISFLSFTIIAIGSIACIAGGYISQKQGEKQTALTALSLSAACCLLSPLMFYLPSSIGFISFLLFWGFMVIADSPLFSTLVAQNAPVEYKGTALTIVNCIGFSITIVSIELTNKLTELINPTYLFLILAIGPVFGILSLLQKDVKD